MRFGEAYSTDLQQIVSINDVERLYEQGLISSKNHFQCKYIECHAPLQCTNLENDKNTRKRRIHFRTNGIIEDHKLDVCGYFEDVENADIEKIRKKTHDSSQILKRKIRFVPVYTSETDITTNLNENEKSYESKKQYIGQSNRPGKQAKNFDCKKLEHLVEVWRRYNHDYR